MNEFSFAKNERLLKPGEFIKARKLGKRYSSKSIAVYVIGNDLGRNRLGLSVSARAGSSVERNRAKRLLREFFRRNKPFFPPSSDILVSVKNASEIGSYREAEAEVREALKRRPR